VCVCVHARMCVCMYTCITSCYCSRTAWYTIARYVISMKITFFHKETACIYECIASTQAIINQQLRIRVSDHARLDTRVGTNTHVHARARAGTQTHIDWNCLNAIFITMLASQQKPVDWQSPIQTITTVWQQVFNLPHTH
jgi:hypothetical protein